MTQFKKENFALRAGEYLRQEIKKHHWTQYAFGRRFGVDVRTVGRWVNEGIDSVSTIESIARFFQVSVWDILSFDDDENVPDPLKSKQQKKTERKLKSFSLYFFRKRTVSVLLQLVVFGMILLSRGKGQQICGSILYGYFYI